MSDIPASALAAWVVAIVVGAPAALLAWRLGWKYFHHFVSRREKYGLSDYVYLIKRIWFAASAAGFAWLATGGAAGLGVAMLFDSPANNDVPTNRQVEAVAVPREAPPSRPTAGAATPVDDVVRQGRQPVPDEATESAAPTLRAPASSDVAPVLTQFTKEEIERLEKEKQYSGDDPIVRQRLGLPPKWGTQ